MIPPRRLSLACPLLVALLSGCTGIESPADLARVLDASGLMGGRQDTVAAGLTEALEIGARNAVALGSAPGGFLDNARIRIPLPRELESLASAMRTFGMKRQVDELEVAMNRAAEQATGEAFDVFKLALRRMTFEDARSILAGSDTAATDYFRRTTSDSLRARFEPIVDRQIHQVGLAQLYGDVMARLRAFPVKLPSTPPLERYVTDRTLDGLFTLLGDEERKIRNDPAARVTELLREVFGRS